MKKDIFAEERKNFSITKIISHHGFKAVEMVRKISRDPKNPKRTILKDPRIRGNLRRK